MDKNIVPTRRLHVEELQALIDQPLHAYKMILFNSRGLADTDQQAAVSVIDRALDALDELATRADPGPSEPQPLSAHAREIHKLELELGDKMREITDLRAQLANHQDAE